MSSLCNLITNPKIGDLFGYITCIIGKSVIPLIFAVAIALFLWGVVQYVVGAEDDKERTIGKQHITWGLIAIAAMLSIWGLVAMITRTFNFGGGFVPQVQVR